MALQGQTADGAFHTGFVDKVGGIHLHVVEFETVDFYLFVQQGQQLHVDHRLADTGNGIFHLRQRVVLPDYFDALDTQIEWKF